MLGGEKGIVIVFDTVAFLAVKVCVCVCEYFLSHYWNPPPLSFPPRLLHSLSASFDINGQIKSRMP